VFKRIGKGSGEEKREETLQVRCAICIEINPKSGGRLDDASDRIGDLSWRRHAKKEGRKTENQKN